MTYSKKIRFFFLTSVLLVFSFLPKLNFAQVQLGQDVPHLIPTFPENSYKTEISGDGSTTVSYSGELEIVLHRWTGSTWAQKGSTIILNPIPYYHNPFVKISNDGNRIAVVLPSGNIQGNVYTSNPGFVRVYDWDGSDWVQKGTDIFKPDDSESFMWAMSVSLSDDGSTIGISDYGKVHFFRWVGTDWAEYSSIDFGAKKVDLNFDGGKVAISNPNYQAGIIPYRQGGVFNYEYIAGNWIQRGAVVIGNFEGWQEGRDVELSGDGTTFITDSRFYWGQDRTFSIEKGNVRVFQFDGTDWVQKGQTLNVETVSSERATENNTVAINYDGTKIIVASGLDVGGYEAGNERVFGTKLDYYIWQNGQWVRWGFNGFDSDATQEIGLQVAMSNMGDTIATQIRKFANRNDVISNDVQVYRWCYLESTAVDTSACDSVVLPNGDKIFASENGYTYSDIVNNCRVGRTYNVTVHPSLQSTDNIQSCDPITWVDGITYTSSNATATWLYQTVNGCDSTVQLNYTRLTDHEVDVQNACGPFTWIDGITYTESNNSASFTLTNEHGCDSLVDLDLTITRLTGTDNITACDSYTWINGITYTSSTTTPKDTIPSALGCDSVVSLNLTILTKTTGTDQIEACKSYTWINGVEYFTSTTGPTDTLVNAVGCDSVVTLDLTIHPVQISTQKVEACDSYTWIDGNTYTSTNNAAVHTLTDQFGCDSIVHLDLTIWNNTGVDVISACDSYTWIDGVTYTSSNSTATHTLTNSHGCDSVVSLNLTMNNSSTSTDVQVACDSLVWMDGITYYTSTNSPTHTLVNAAGCDSVIHLDLQIFESDEVQDAYTECNTFTWINGKTYTSSNHTDFVTYTNQQGCDSTIYLQLDLYSDVSTTQNETACDAYAWIDGNTYTSSTNSPTHTLQTSQGCDSVVTLNLTINHSTTGVDLITACDSYTWIDGNTYTASTNSVYHTIPNSVGCDSVINLQLTILKSSSYTDVQSACESYTWIDGNTYTASTNSPTFVLTNSVGCDSVVTLDLSILNNTGVDTQFDCESFTWIDGNTYTESNNTATHTLVNQFGCDSVVTLDLTIGNNSAIDNINACDSYTWINGQTYTSSNNTDTHVLTNSMGCDSVVELNLYLTYSNTGIDVVTDCDSHTWIDGNTYTSNTNSPTFTLTNQDGCDSTVTLHLTLLSSSSFVDVREECGPYTWINGVSYSTNNNTATHTLTNAQGCDSTVYLDLTVLNDNVQDQITDCDPIVWIDGNTYSETTSGVSHTLTNEHGCDSVVWLDYTRLSNSGLDVIQACDSYQWIDGQTYTTSNSTAQYTLQNTHGCDSLVSLQLTILKSDTVTEQVTACDSYIWVNGTNYTSSSQGDEFVYSKSNGCDSVVVLDLTILESSQGIDSIVSCGPYTWIDGIEYAQSNSTATHVLPNAAGCDSTVYLELTVWSGTSSIDSVVACESYTWMDGNTYTASNYTATHTLTNQHGCDSVVRLHLDMNYNSEISNAQQSCNAYYWPYADTTILNSGMYSFTKTASTGCDSTHHLDLEIVSDVVTVLQESACQTYHWPTTGVTYTASGVYVWNTASGQGCDSLVELHLTIHDNDTIHETLAGCDSVLWAANNTWYSTSGQYAFSTTNANGCLDVHELDLTIVPTFSDTLEVDQCGSFYWDRTDSTYAESTTASINYPRASGCDSVYVLNYVRYPEYQLDDYAQICDSMYWEPLDLWISETGTYVANLSTHHGCDSILQLDAEVFSSSFVHYDTIACGATYFWDRNAAQLDESGVYTDTEQDQNGCDDTEELSLFLGPLGSVQIVVEGTLIRVVAPPESELEWFFCGASGDCISIGDEKELEALDNGTYELLVRYEECELRVSIPMDLYSCGEPLYIPNSFTPNGDGFNEFFSIVNRGCYLTNFSVQIFDRWGAMVYSSKDEKFAWDGTLDGQILQNGVYIYRLKYRNEAVKEKEQVQFGRIELLR